MLGVRLRELREERKLLQIDLANILGVSRTTYTQYETGKSEPSFETVSMLADYFNVSVDYLLGRTDTKNTDKIANSLIDDEDLSIFWDDLKEREDLQLLFKQTKDLSPKGIQQVIRIIKAIEDEEDRENE